MGRIGKVGREVLAKTSLKGFILIILSTYQA
jgi:hypothetical protein